MTVGDAVSKRIIQLCKEYNITPNKLSIISGITQSTINNIINTGSKNPTISTIKKICDGLEITLSQFFDDDIFDSLEQEVR